MSKYFYKDKETGKPKKYVGNTIERDGKTYGNLVTSETKYVMQELKSVDNKRVIDTEIISYAWKDKFGVEHDLSDTDNVIDNKVIDKREYTLDVIFHPEIKEDIYFIRKDNKTRYDGEIFTKNNKTFGKIQKEFA